RQEAARRAHRAARALSVSSRDVLRDRPLRSHAVLRVGRLSTKAPPVVARRVLHVVAMAGARVGLPGRRACRRSTPLSRAIRDLARSGNDARTPRGALAARRRRPLRRKDAGKRGGAVGARRALLAGPVGGTVEPALAMG